MQNFKFAIAALICLFSVFNDNDLMGQKNSDDPSDTTVIADPLTEILVKATRAGEKAPTTFTNVSKEKIEERNIGVDVPYLLQLTPSAVVTSDAGTGIGYTGIRIRGTDPSRINVQINGIPLNDSESQGVFWVNLPDFASSTNSIQVQRGVGTSVNGAGAFGGSINMMTNKINSKPYAELNGSIGSFNTQKSTISLGTGILNNHWSFDGRYSRIHSDGFIDRARADLNSYFASAAYLGKNNSFRLNVFSGHEITYQAWYGTTLAEIEAENFTDNPSGIYTDDDGETRYHNDEVDNYKQTHAQFHYSQRIGQNILLNTSLHYTKGQGFFEQYKEAEDLEDYGLEAIEIPLLDSLGNTIGSGNISSSDLIRRRWLDNDFFGGILNLKYEKNNIELILGGGLNQYVGDHFGEIIWAKYASNSEIYDRYYDNRGKKTDGNIYLKANINVSDDLLVFADAQFRAIKYYFKGIDNDFTVLDQNQKLNFFNPKLGLTYQLNNQQQVYASWAVAQREPNRSDFTEAPPSQQPKPEKLNDFELGYRLNQNKYAFSANIYYMLYKDQLALDGGINDVGEYTRINIPESYRLGLELVGGCQLTDWLNWEANATISQNKIKSFTEKIDAYNAPNYEWEQVLVNYENTDLAFSPNLIAASDLSFKLFDSKINASSKSHKMNLSLITKYVGKQFIDNSSNENGNLLDLVVNETVNDRFLDPYVIADANLNYSLKNVIGKEIKLSFVARNLLNSNYISNAYAFRYIVDNEVLEGEGYFPQAGINFMGVLGIKF